MYKATISGAVAPLAPDVSVEGGVIVTLTICMFFVVYLACIVIMYIVFANITFHACFDFLHACVHSK